MPSEKIEPVENAFKFEHRLRRVNHYEGIAMVEERDAAIREEERERTRRMMEQAYLRGNTMGRFCASLAEALDEMDDVLIAILAEAEDDAE